jgi:hypothetical protein
MAKSIAARIASVRQQLAALPEASEPPPTALQVLGRGGQERDWQQFLVHFLSPEKPHGLNHALLEHVLTALADRSELEYTFSRFDIEEIQIAQEVVTEQGRPDVLVWVPEEWFLCFELKVHASEGEDQTPRYVDIESFDGIGVEKADVPCDGHNYVFVAPEAASEPDAEEFVHVSWEWLVGELQSFLMESYDEYPARTTAQLKEFIDTIRSELTMSEYEENQQEMVELFIENYDVITELEDAFDEEWASFEDSWGTRLAQALDDATLVEDAEIPAEYAAVSLPIGDEQRQWTFRQGKSDWSWSFPREWWTKLDEQRQVSETAKPNARVGFVHRLGQNRDEAVRDNTLIVTLRNAPSGHDTFYNGFANRFSDAAAEIRPAIADTNYSITGNKSNVLRGEYPIKVDAHESFFDAYIAALARAITQGAIGNPDLFSTIDRLYTETIDEDVSL